MITEDAVLRPPISGTTSESGMGSLKVRRSLTRTRPVATAPVLSMGFIDCLKFQRTLTICSQ